VRLSWAAKLASAHAFWALILCAALGSCLVREPLDFEAPPLSFESETRRNWFPDGQRSTEESVLEWSDGRIERHGRNRAWYVSGQLRFERFYDHEKPIGSWRSWYESGAPASEMELGDGETLGRMRFYFESGQLAGEGQGVGGLREGPWSYWHANGQLASEGSYVGMQKQGDWLYWDSDGNALATANEVTEFEPL